MKLCKRGVVRDIPTSKKKNHSECIEKIRKSENDAESLNQYTKKIYIGLGKNFRDPLFQETKI